MSCCRPKVIIVLLNYNGAEDTIGCLQSLQEITYLNYHIVIVDNASPDGSWEKIEHYLRTECVDHSIFNRPEDSAVEYAGKLPLVTFIQSGENGGYGYGNNVGIKYALVNNADYVLLLNNDTVVAPNFLEPLVEMCEADETIGIASGKIYFHNSPNVLWFNGGRFDPYTAKIEHVNFNEKDIGQNPPIINTFISGCLWLIPGNIFEIVGLINEDYFMYVEDLEFSQRILMSGYKLKVSEQSHIWHKVGRSSGGRYSNITVYYRSKNYILFAKKHISNPFWRLISILFFTVRCMVHLLKHKQFSLIKEAMRGVANGFWHKT